MNSKNVHKNDIFPFHQVFSVKRVTHKLKRPPSNTRMDLCASFKKNLVAVSSVLSENESISGDTILRIKGSGKYRCRDRQPTKTCDHEKQGGLKVRKENMETRRIFSVVGSYCLLLIKHVLTSFLKKSKNVATTKCKEKSFTTKIKYFHVNSQIFVPSVYKLTWRNSCNYQCFLSLSNQQNIS